MCFRWPESLIAILLAGISLALSPACAQHNSKPLVRDTPAGIAPASPVLPHAELTDRFAVLIPELMREHDVPGLGVAVVDRGGILWTQGFGHTDRSHRVSVTPGTPFSIQSASKTLTTTAVLLAVQEGVLDLDAPITTYVPEFTVRSRFGGGASGEMTLRHLLSHTAGLTHEAPVGNNFDPGTASFDEHVRSISRTWLRFPVGQRYSYSNLGVDLAGYALERVSGVRFAAYVRDKLLTPLEMTDSTFDSELVARWGERAIGHKKGYAHVPLRVPMVPSGGMYASVRDLARFVQFHLNSGHLGSGAGVNLRSDLLAEMYRIPWPVTGQSEGYALGIVRHHRNARLHFTHGGGGFGFLSDMMWVPEAGLGVVILTNSSDHPLQGDLAQQILDAFVEERMKSDAPLHTAQVGMQDAVVPDQGATGQALVGTYIGRSGLRRVAPCDSGVCMISGKESFALRFTSATEAQWIRPDERVRYRFQTHRGSKPLHMVRVADGEVWDYNDGPQDDGGPNDPRWDAYTGTYSVTIWGQVADKLVAHRKNGYLYLDDMRLTEHQPGLFFTADGEALDFTNRPPTFANVTLTRTDR